MPYFPLIHGNNKVEYSNNNMDYSNNIIVY